MSTQEVSPALSRKVNVLNIIQSPRLKTWPAVVSCVQGFKVGHVKSCLKLAEFAGRASYSALDRKHLHLDAANSGSACYCLHLPAHSPNPF
jgi:hypothetical protein